jgi:hypothetical protein
MRDHDENDPDRFRIRGTPTARVYVHRRCGEMTQVSGGDYSHICDPFWPCTATFCCGCNGMVPLSDVRWEDTGEPISDYRRRLRSKTPGLVQAWRFGLGFAAGAAIGSGIGLLIGLAGATLQNLIRFVVAGGVIGAVVVYLVGTMILNRVFDIDYRRMP